MMPSRSVLPEKRENGKETSRRKLERNRTARLKPERIAARMTMPKHRNSVIKLPKQMRWR